MELLKLPITVSVALVTIGQSLTVRHNYFPQPRGSTGRKRPRNIGTGAYPSDSYRVGRQRIQ